MLSQLCKYIKTQWLYVELLMCLIHKLNLNKAIYQPSIESQVCLSILNIYLDGLGRLDHFGDVRDEWGGMAGERDLENISLMGTGESSLSHATGHPRDIQVLVLSNKRTR